jgi:hypothetical protein
VRLVLRDRQPHQRRCGGETCPVHYDSVSVTQLNTSTLEIGAYNRRSAHSTALHAHGTTGAGFTVRSRPHRDPNGERWTATVTYVFRENVKNNELAVNPLGLTIVRFRG